MTPLLDALRGLFGGKTAPRAPKAPPPLPAPPDDTNPEGLRRWLVDAVGLSDARAREIAALALPTIGLRVAEMAVDDWPGVVSKLGGAPDVPAGFAWPEMDGVVMPFIAQVKLAELSGMPAASALPGDGVLSFFCHPGHWGHEPHDRGSARVYWFPDSTALRRMRHPAGMLPDGVFPAGRLAMREIVTLPSTYDPAVEAMQLTLEEEELYVEVAIDVLLRPEGATTKHQLLGHADPVQGEMTVDCQRASSGLTTADEQALPEGRRAALAAEARRWRLLAQWDTDDAVDMMWGDGGMLYFWITEEDLAARRFDRTWMVLQCS